MNFVRRRNPSSDEGSADILSAVRMTNVTNFVESSAGYIPFLVEIFYGSLAPAPHGAGAGRCYDLDSEPLCNARCSIGI